MGRRRGGGRRRGSFKVRLLIGVVLALFALGQHFLSRSTNPVTGETDYTSIQAHEDLRFGLQAMDELAYQFGGPSSDLAAQQRVEQIGARLVDAIQVVYGDTLQDLPYEFSFTLLEDDQVVNAFALPGGPTFITEALYRALGTEDAIAGVMGHEIGHVLHRHGAERIAKQELMSGLAGATVMASGDYTTGQVASMVGNFLQMKYGREDELESDKTGLRLMDAAGYDPAAMVRVMQVLNEASGGARGGTPEWASTHPHPESRIEQIQQILQEMGHTGHAHAGHRH